ncbi:MAG: hypothetical protein ABSG64_09400 [Solirubrobacteraceae bacterium]|jgi:hypothetical protein
MFQSSAPLSSPFHEIRVTRTPYDIPPVIVPLQRWARLRALAVRFTGSFGPTRSG